MSDSPRRLSRPRRDNDPRPSSVIYAPTPQSPSQSPPPSVTFSGYAHPSSAYPPSGSQDGPRRRPQSPRSIAAVAQPQMRPLLSPPPRSDTTTQRVASGAIGGGYGPYAHHMAPAMNDAPRRFSAAMSTESAYTVAPTVGKSPYSMMRSTTTATTLASGPWLTDDLDADDPLHDPKLSPNFRVCSGRGCLNGFVLFMLLVCMLGLFLGYPLTSAFTTKVGREFSAGNLGGLGLNASGQVPQLNMPTLIDKDTPLSAMTREGTDGYTYNLVFSDEFEVDGRTFWPGDDPYWEAVDLHYWPTGNLEWDDPQAITTQDGNLVITISETNTHNLSFQSGMMASWNKFCFTTGYVEVNVSLPGAHDAPGFWPAIWTLGNLGRAGYGATTEGTWPYSYDSCDVGTFPAQMYKNQTPASSLTDGAYGGVLSSTLGQRLSACTCPGSDHPGPSVTVGRGVPEIDVFEAQIESSTMQGEVSQSFQTAPFSANYYFSNQTPAVDVYDYNITHWNTYTGGPLQQALSAVTWIDNDNYGGNGYATYGFEWWSDPKNREDGYITWFSQGVKSWTVTAAAIGPDSTSKVSQRLIPEEPMHLIMNLGMSPSFEHQDFMHLVFPSSMYVDYIRVYQREGANNIGCDPPDYPTADYISRHADAYNNANLTTWASTNNTWPPNSQYDGCS